MSFDLDVVAPVLLWNAEIGLAVKNIKPKNATVNRLNLFALGISSSSADFVSTALTAQPLPALLSSLFRRVFEVFENPANRLRFAAATRPADGDELIAHMH